MEQYGGQVLVSLRFSVAIWRAGFDDKFWLLHSSIG
jgi:hypothetical protein